MSELRRWSAEDATPEEQRLLEASRGERPDPAALARTLLALGIAGPPGGGPTSGPGGAGAAGANGVARRTTLVKLLVLGGGALALVAVVVGAMSRTRQDVEPLHIPPPAEVSAREPPNRTPAAAAITASKTPEAAPNEAPSLDPPPGPRTKLRRRTQRTSREEPADPSLAEEVAALDQARAGLAARDTSAALRALDVYRARFVRGKLADEEIVLRVQALVARGDRAGAAAVERAFAKAHPQSPYVARLRALVGAAEKADEEK